MDSDTAEVGPVTSVRSNADLASLDRAFESASAAEIIRWAVEEFGSGLALATSMTDAVLIDLAVKVEPLVEVFFIDTGYHFDETLHTVEAVRLRYALDLRILSCPGGPHGLWRSDPDGCCAIRKVGQLDRALQGKSAWLSGLRRAESATRADLPIVSRDVRGLVKVNPIANWSDLDVRHYIADNDVPVNPLVAQGYSSIGCQPCTRPVALGAEPRSGRWVGFDKTECGLHL